MLLAKVMRGRSENAGHLFRPSRRDAIEAPAPSTAPLADWRKEVILNENKKRWMAWLIQRCWLTWTRMESQLESHLVLRTNNPHNHRWRNALLKTGWQHPIKQSASTHSIQHETPSMIRTNYMNKLYELITCMKYMLSLRFTALAVIFKNEWLLGDTHFPEIMIVTSRLYKACGSRSSTLISRASLWGWGARLKIYQP